jgi:hypothetical protein
MHSYALLIMKCYLQNPIVVCEIPYCHAREVRMSKAVPIFAKLFPMCDFLFADSYEMYNLSLRADS